MTRPLWLQRLLLVFIGVPVALAIMIFDAACCAWDEFVSDWRGAVEAFRDVWRGE